MPRTSLFFLFVVSFGILCLDARRISQRDSCKPFGKGRGNTTREVCIKQTGRSGKFSISLGRNKGEDDLKTVTIMFVAIREIDKDGGIIGNKGPRAGKHSYENFAQLEFNYSDLVNTTYKGIEAYGFNFYAVLPGPNATLNIPIYIFKKNGTIDLCNDETMEIKRGMVKFNIELSNWNFCKTGSGCGQRGRNNEEEIGDSVDFVIVIKNRGKAVKGRKNKKQRGMKREAMKIHFGNNTISFPSAIESDGSCKEMAEDYPKLDAKGGKCSFRFPKFSDKVIFDPGVNVIDDEEPPPPEPEGSGAKLLFPSFGVVMILGVLARFFI